MFVCVLCVLGSRLEEKIKFILLSARQYEQVGVPFEGKSKCMADMF